LTATSEYKDCKFSNCNPIFRYLDKQRGVPNLILERADCIASLWQQKTYDCLCLHLPKQFYELPLMTFPNNFPTYPTKQQFLAYLKAYADHFDIKHVFNKLVAIRELDQQCAFWRVKTSGQDHLE